MVGNDQEKQMQLPDRQRGRVNEHVFAAIFRLQDVTLVIGDRR
jgi:hypothetical protein